MRVYCCIYCNKFSHYMYWHCKNIASRKKLRGNKIISDFCQRLLGNQEAIHTHSTFLLNCTERERERERERDRKRERHTQKERERERDKWGNVDFSFPFSWLEALMVQVVSIYLSLFLLSYHTQVHSHSLTHKRAHIFLHSGDS